jgi:hypothetical protein
MAVVLKTTYDRPASRNAFCAESQWLSALLLRHLSPKHESDALVFRRHASATTASLQNRNGSNKMPTHRRGRRALARPPARRF